MCKDADTVCFWLKPDGGKSHFVFVVPFIWSVTCQMVHGMFFRRKLTETNWKRSELYQAAEQHVVSVGRVMKRKDSKFHGCTFVCLPRSAVRIQLSSLTRFHDFLCCFCSFCAVAACHHNGNLPAFLMTDTLFVAAAAAAAADYVPQELFVYLTKVFSSFCQCLLQAIRRASAAATAFL